MSFKDLFVQKNSESDIPDELKRLAVRQRPTDAPRRTMPEIDMGPEVDISAFDTSNVVPINEIYTKEGIGDLSRSIFKVDEIRKVIPAALPTDAKKQTVLGMLTVAGLDTVSLFDDADKRMGILEATRESLTGAASNQIAVNQSKIAELEAQIDELKRKNNELKNTDEAQNKLIADEVSKITEIVTFIGPKEVTA